MGASALEKRTGSEAPASGGVSPKSGELRRAVSVVIVSYWTGPLLRRCLGSVLQQPGVREILLIDNGNWDQEIERAVAMGDDTTPPIRLFSGHGNIGFAAACNLGAQHATGDYLLILNPDAVIETGGVEKLVREGVVKPRPWMLGAKLIDPEGGKATPRRR